MKQILLSTKHGCSGRGVRLKLLSPSERSNALETAAREIGAEATMIDLRLREAQNGIAAMVGAVTKETGFAKKDDLAAATWQPVSMKDLDGRLDAYFSAKDVDALGAIFKRMHGVTDKEVEDILGEALDVTEA